MPKSIKDSELKAVIAALESDMNAAFEVSKAGLLAKADDGAKDGPPAESSDDSATPPDSSASASPGPDASAPPPGPDAAATPSPDASAPPAGAPGMDPAMGDPAAAQAPLTPEALQAEYAQLSPEELDMHLKAAMSAKEALAAASAPPAGAPPGADPMASASPAGAPPPGASPAASPAPGLPPEMGKGELKGDMAPAGTPASHAKANGGQMKKSEDPEIAALKAELEGVRSQFKNAQEDVEILTKSVKMVLERPMQKAVTGINYLSKAEPVQAEVKKTFTLAEAKAKIAELIPTLSKSEREQVLKASATGKFADLAPILEKHVK